MEPNTNTTPIPTNQVVENNMKGPIELLLESWIFFKKQWKKIVPIVAFPILIITLAQILFIFENRSFTILAALLFIVGMVFSIASSPAGIDALRKISSGENIDFKQQYSIGFKWFWSVMLVSVFQGAIVIGGLLLFIVPGIIFMVLLTFTMFTLVIDGKKGLSAIVGSYELVRGRWFKVFGRALLLVPVFILVGLVVSLVGVFVSLVSGIKADSDIGNILTIIANLIVSGFVGGFVVVYMYKMFDNLKSLPSKVTNSTGFRRIAIVFTTIGVIMMIAISLIVGFISGLTVFMFTDKLMSDNIFGGEDIFLPQMDSATLDLTNSTIQEVEAQ